MRRLAQCGGVLVLIATLVACGGGEAEGLIKAGQRLVSKPTTIEDLTKASSELKTLPKGEFSSADWATRTQLLADLDRSTLSLQATLVDRTITSVRPQVTQRGQQLALAAIDEAQTAGRGTPEDAFTTAFQEASADAVKDAACGVMLDLIAPDQRPADAKGSDDPDTLIGWTLTTLQQGAGQFGPTGVRNFIAMESWAQGAIEDGQQVASALGAYPDQYLQLATRPPVQRALVAYLRYCYSPPRLVT